MLPKEVSRNNCYNVSYNEATYYVKDKALCFDYLSENSAIVRIFPLEDYINDESKKDLEEYKFDIIYIKEKNLVVLKDEQELNKLFNYTIFAQ